VKVVLKALGCRLNEAELEQWARDFRRQGHTIITEPEDADIIVLNSCAVTLEAGKKSRKLLNRLYRSNPEAHLVVTGCYASLNQADVAATLGVDLVVSNAEKDQLAAIVSEKFAIKMMPLIAMEPEQTSLFIRGRHRAFIKIQDGCRYRCTYCIVTVARGEERSRSEAEIITEINDFHQQGLQEVVLTGVHVGGYGSDLKSSLYQLVTHILAETDIPRIRFASVEPWDLPPSFFTLFENTRLMPHMHLPIQSGVDSVMRRMSRRCKTAEFTTLVQQVRQVVPHFNVTTDIIVGFPGETEVEWQQTLEYVESVGFGHLHVFSFSPREGTKAAGLANPIAKPVKKQRSIEMRALGDRLRQDFYERHIGTTANVLWERAQKKDAGQFLVSGYSPNYLKAQVVVPSAEYYENTIEAITFSHYISDSVALSGKLKNRKQAC
jgi:threonylcarbamoyladenosine tRNA methylthiotransferase MtaB